MSPELRRYPKAIRIALSCITVAALLLMISGYFSERSITLVSILNLTIQCAFVLLLNRFPKSIICFYALFLALNAFSSSQFTIEYWGVWLILLYAGLILRTRYAIPLVLSLACLQVISYAIYRDSSYTLLGVISVISLFLFFTSIGIGLRSFNLIQNQRVQILELEKEKAEQEQLESKNRLIEELHNSLASTLTDITLCSYQNRKETNPAESAQRNALIYQLALQSVQEVHHIIDVIDNATDLYESIGNDARADSLFGEEGSKTIQTFLRAEDLKANAAGLKGSSLIQGKEDILLPASVLVEVKSILREIYTNIKKHASPEKLYVVSVTITHEGIAIYSSNLVKKAQSKTIDSGFGLKDLRNRISKLGGEAILQIEDAELQLTIYFPLKGK